MAYRTDIEHHRLYPWTSLMAAPYSCDATGTNDCASSIEDIKTNQANVGTIYVPHGTFLVDTNLTIPAGMALKFEDGGIISVGAGKTLTIAGDVRAVRSAFTIASGGSVTITGSIAAGNYQVFSGAGTVTMTSSPSAANAMWWGAVGDGSTGGQEVFINAALLAARKVYLPPGDGEYIVDNEVYVPSDTEFFGDMYNSIIKVKADFGNTRIINNKTTTPANQAARDTNIHIHDLTIDGNKANNSTGTEWAHCIHLWAVDGATIENINCLPTKGDGLDISYYSGGTDTWSEDVTVRNLKAYNVSRNGISVTGAVRVAISDCIIEDTGMGGIDVEPDNDASSKCQDITIKGCVIKDIGLTAQELTEWCLGIQVAGSGTTHPIINNVAVTGNVINNVDGDYGAGINYRYVQNLTVTGNTIKDAYYNGISSVDEGQQKIPYPACDVDFFDTKGTGWSYDAGNDEYDCDASQVADSDLGEAGILENGLTYVVRFMVKNYVAGNVVPVCGTTEGTDRSADGSYTEVIVSDGTDFKIRGDVNFDGSVDSIYVYPVYSKNIVVSNNVVDGGANGIGLGHHIPDVILTGNIVRGTTSNGFNINPVRSVVANNTVYATTGPGFTMNLPAESIIEGNASYDNSASYGYYVDSPTRCSFVGNMALDNSNGFYFGGNFSNCNVVGNNANGNTTNINISTLVNQNSEFAGNLGLVTEAWGISGAIATAGTVTHGLAGTPDSVVVTAAETGPTDIYTSAVGATTFAVNFGGGGNKTFYWYAKYIP